MLKKFFEEVLPNDNTNKLIWTQDDKKSHWYKDVKTLIEYIEFRKDNVYFGVGTTEKTLPSYARATAQDIYSIRMMHMDIDIQSSLAHKNDRLPETIEDAMKIARAVLDPTYIVNSGYGLHVYWLFDAHQIIENHDFWTLLMQSWQQAHRDLFPQYDIDATHDLARIMRCPGSLNCKDPENPVPCEIIEHDDTAYYMPEQIEDAIDFDPSKAIKVDIQNNDSSATRTILKNKRLTTQESLQYIAENNLTIADANPLDLNVILNINNLEPAFIDEYNNKTKRKSASEYQLRLANICAKCGMDDQQILDVMVNHRRHNKHDLQLNRPEKYINDLLKAKQTYCLNKLEEKPKEKITSNDLESIRAYLYSKLDIQIYKLWRFEQDPNCHFELELADYPKKNIFLGTFKDGIMNQDNFYSKVGAVISRLPANVNKKFWRDDIVRKLLLLTFDGDTVETNTYEGQVRIWAEEYIFSKTPHESLEAYFENSAPGDPFFHKDRVYFQFESMCQWIRTNKGVNLNVFHFGVAMTKNGFIQDRIVNKDGYSIYLWATPIGYRENKAN